MARDSTAGDEFGAAVALEGDTLLVGAFRDDGIGSAGEGSTHAWVEVFVPGAGWIPFDPTNRSVGSANLIPVAVARRIEQVAPVTGSFHGVGSDLISMDVRVSVECFSEEPRIES